MCRQEGKQLWEKNRTQNSTYKTNCSAEHREWEYTNLFSAHAIAEMDRKVKQKLEKIQWILTYNSKKSQTRNKTKFTKYDVVKNYSVWSRKCETFHWKSIKTIRCMQWLYLFLHPMCHFNRLFGYSFSSLAKI